MKLRWLDLQNLYSFIFILFYFLQICKFPIFKEFAQSQKENNRNKNLQAGNSKLAWKWQERDVNTS